MRNRRVLLCLPELPSDEALALARTVKAALSTTFQVRLYIAGEDFDDDATPVDGSYNQPLVLKIEEPSDDGESVI